MNANELRIGNYILSEFGAFFLVRGISHKNKITASKSFSTVPVDFKITDFKPIELTEEVLLNCGFEIIINNVLRLNNIDLIYTKDSPDVLVLKHGTALSNIKHLHQLQNLYFAMTGEELEINL